MKKLLAICFGLVLCFALGVTAMAAEFTVNVDYWSTLNNASVEDSYEVLKTKVTTALCKDAKVQILDSNENVKAEADTNADGVATFDEKPSDAAKIRVSKDGCITKTENIATENTQDITLERPILKVVPAEGSTGRFEFRYDYEGGTQFSDGHIVLWDVKQPMIVRIASWGWSVIRNITYTEGIKIASGSLYAGNIELNNHATITVETMAYGKVALKSNLTGYDGYLTFYTPDSDDVHNEIGFSSLGDVGSPNSERYGHYFIGTYDVLVTAPNGYVIDSVRRVSATGSILKDNVNAPTCLIENYEMQTVSNDNEGIYQNIYVEYKQCNYVNVTASEGGTVTTTPYGGTAYTGTVYVPVGTSKNGLNDNVEIDITANDGHYIKSVIVQDGDGNVLKTVNGDTNKTTEKFRISVNDKLLDNINTPVTDSLHGEEEYEVEVIFGSVAEQTYNVYLRVPSGSYGTIKQNPFTVNYNGSSTVTISNIRNNKTVSHITVKKDGESTATTLTAEQYTVNHENKTITVPLNNITADTYVSVYYKDIDPAPSSYISKDISEKIWKDPDSNTYYTNGDMVRLCSTADGKTAGVEKIRVMGGEYTYLDPEIYNYTYRILTGEVPSVELYYQKNGDIFKEWHIVENWTPINVILDEDAPEVEVTFNHEAYGTEINSTDNKTYYLYSKDAGKIEVTVNVTDVGSGLASARYEIYGHKDGKKEVPIVDGFATIYIDPNNHQERAVLQVYAADNVGGSQVAIFERYIRFTDKLSVSYDANGGTGSVTDGNYDPGATETVISDDAFAREGYRFVEWNTQADGKGTSYKPGDTLTVNQSMTLYAIWEKIPGETEPEQGKPAEPCDHKLDENGKCSRCGVVIITYPRDEGETNPNTGAPVIAPIAFAVIAAAACVLKKK